MKPVVEKHGDTIASASLTPVPMGISEDPEDQLMILNVLTNTLYSDKPAAIWREYGCNAADATVEAKQDKPIEIWLPNRLEPTVRIRDYGAGMNEEQVLKTFCKLGRSTKRNSNEFTGMMGIGSKAGFAYGDSFMVLSYVGGTLSVYNAYRDKGVPRLALMHTEKTAEPDGIEIKVPIRVPDIEEFQRKAERVFRYFIKRPVVHGGTLTFDRNVPQITGKNWRYVGDNRSVAIMGNVGYDLTLTSLTSIDSKLYALLSMGVEMDFAIGDLEIAASREGLQYKDHTKNALVARLKEICAEIGASFTDRMKKAKTLWEAKALYHDLFEKGQDVYTMRSLKDIVTGNVTWNGKKIDSSRYDIRTADRTGVNTWWITKHWNNHLRRTENPYDAHASATTHLVVNDLESGKSSPNRERGFFQNNPDTTGLLILSFADDKCKERYLKETGLDDAPLQKLSTFPVVKSVTAGGGSHAPSVHKNKHSAEVFILIEGKNISSSTCSEHWDIDEVDLQKDGGLYVVIENFRVRPPMLPPGNFFQDPAHIEQIVRRLRKAGLVSTPIYGFKKTVLDTLGKKWVKLEDHLTKQMARFMRSKPRRQELSDYLAAASYHHLFDSKRVADFPVKSPVHKWLEKQAKMFSPSSHKELMIELHAGRFYEWVKTPATPPPTFDLAAQEKAILERYPMLGMLSHLVSYGGRPRYTTIGKDDLQKIVNYVKLIDKL